MNKKNKTGFTLVELLVVISIIAMLLAVLMPSLQKARAQARKIVCISHLSQWAVAVQAYATSNNGYYPVRQWQGKEYDGWSGLNTYYRERPPYGDRAMNGSYDLISIFFKPYMGKMEKVITCPENQNPAFKLSWDEQKAYWKKQTGEYCVLGSYFFYVGVPFDSANWKAMTSIEILNCPPRKLTKGDVPIAGDMVYADDYGSNSIYWVYSHPSRYGYWTKEPAGMPAAFSDGHAQWVPYNGLTKFMVGRDSTTGGAIRTIYTPKSN